uniref:Uncharacterized protein LOC111133699 n=1 Tax=Crassostrea virginica TaxID=6565 RepID=A0A8B8EEM0_CRAVI|nr:uncharacterized protein LOC111133699 [Crassostrea virginica]
MDPHHSGQDVMRCTACVTALAPMYCEVCHIDLCKDCAEKHIADKSKVHRIVSLKQFLAAPKCQDHPNKQCELHCEQCDVPICSQCVISKKHKHHGFVDILENCQKKQEVLKKDLEEFEKSIYPIYQEAALRISHQRINRSKNSQKLKTTIQNHGDMLHKEIDSIIQEMQSKIDDDDAQYLALLDKREKEIKRNISQISEIILNLKRLLESGNVNIVAKYKSRNREFRMLPTIPNVSVPNFQPQEINREELLKQFGSLTHLSKDEEGYMSICKKTKYSPKGRPLLLDVPKLITELDTGYKKYYHGVSCLSDVEIWIRGNGKSLELYNLRGELLKSVRTISGKIPNDIAVTVTGDLVYTDYDDSSINLVRNTQVQTLIKLYGWKPGGVCTTSSHDILVSMESKDGKESKIVRYSRCTEKQIIQWDEQGHPLYSNRKSLKWSSYIKYLCQNGNLDICVADDGANAVVVVSAAGKLRFRYTGSPSNPYEEFCPCYITTDSENRILISETEKSQIHLVDQDGNFLRLFDNCGLQGVTGLCVDSRDNLFVVEQTTGKVKKIQYYQ